MARHWTRKFSYTTGTVRYKDLAYVIISDDRIRKRKIPDFDLIEWDGGTWRDGGGFDWNCTTITIVKTPKEQAMAVGEFGEVVFLGGGDKHVESIAPPDSVVVDRGPLRGCRYIGKHAYVVGMDRQVYRRKGVNDWEAIDNGCRPDPESEAGVGFEAVDGFSEKEIYAAGWDGEIWLYNGKKWRQLASPTNTVITNLRCCGEEVYCCGLAGLLLVGRGDEWRIIEQDEVDDDIWGLEWYREQVYFSTMGAVYRLLKDDVPEMVDMGDDVPETCYHLSAADGVLWSIGSKDVMAFDGKIWTRID